MEIELQRIQQEYEKREHNILYQKLYSALNEANLYEKQSRERAVMALLRRRRLLNFQELSLLDVGCGEGQELLRWITYGVAPELCAGIDLVSASIDRARGRIPQLVELHTGSASKLCYANDRFDIVTVFTVFSSILDIQMQQSIAREMLRVLRPTGMIIWYDFWLNPTNKATCGIRLKEIKRLFPQCTYDATLVTLAPPIARVVAKRSFLLASLLELLPLRTHWLVGIKPQPVQ